MTKNEARKKYKQLRLALTKDQVVEQSQAICGRLIDLKLNFETVHLFFPIRKFNEVDLEQFFHHCNAQNKTCCTSVSDFETSQMKTIVVDSATKFTENDWGIPEPVEGRELDDKKIDLVIIPLLYADKEGNRIGYGKGFYDRFLSHCRADVQKIGVSYFPTNESISEVDLTDVKIDVLITPIS